MKKHTKITAKELEERFDKGEDVLQFFDTAAAEIEEPKTQRVNVDFPEWVVRRLDDEASRLAISRQSLIKLVVSDALTDRPVPQWRPRQISSRPYATQVAQYLAARLQAPEDETVIDLVEYLQKALSGTEARRRLKKLEHTIGTAAR